MRLLWRDVINLLCYCHHKNFAVLLWFAIIAFKRTVYRSIILDIFNMIWPHNLFFYNKFSQRRNIARSHKIETSTSNEPVIGH